MYFFRAAAFLKFSVFERVISLQQSFFSEYLIFRNKIFVKTGSSFGQLLLGTATFLWTICLEQRYLLKSSSDRSRYIYLRSISILRSAKILENPLFTESYLFIAATFSKDVTFYSSNLVRRATFSQHTFSEKLLFHC